MRHVLWLDSTMCSAYMSNLFDRRSPQVMAVSVNRHNCHGGRSTGRGRGMGQLNRHFNSAQSSAQPSAQSSAQLSAQQSGQQQTTSTTVSQRINCHPGGTCRPTTEYLSRSQRSWPWQREQGLMDYVPPSSGRAPTPLDSGDRPVQPPQGGLAGKSQVIPLASQGSRGDANRLDLSPRVQSSLRLCKCNLPFDSASVSTA